MVFVKVECITIRCDTCGNGPEEYMDDYFEDEQEAINHMQENEWIVWEDKHWCEVCDAPVCTCSHTFGKHFDGEAECEVAGCECKGYTPKESEEAT